MNISKRHELALNLARTIQEKDKVEQALDQNPNDGDYVLALTVMMEELKVQQSEIVRELKELKNEEE